MKLREPRIGGRHYRLHPLDTTEGVNSAHALTLSIIEGRRITRISREKIKAGFTFNNIAAYTAPVAAKSAAGFGDPMRVGERTASPVSFAVFLCSMHGKPVMGGPCGRPSGLPVPIPGSPTCTVPLTLVWRQGGGFKSQNRNLSHA